MTHYLNLTKKQAETALQEFLDERGPALQRFRASLAADGQNPDVLLDGTVESLVPLWRWTLSRLTGPDAPGATDPAGAPGEQWPSWERYTFGTDPTLSRKSVTIIDGVVSYLWRVVERGAPKAQWRLGFDRRKGYVWQNYPVFAVDGEEVPLAELVVPAARGHVSGQMPSADDELARAAASVIERLNVPDEETVGPDGPIVEVEDLGDDPIRGRELSLSLHEEIASEHSNTVDRLAEELKTQDGITGVLREDREVLLVATPAWTTTQLENWATQYLQKHIRELRAPRG